VFGSSTELWRRRWWKSGDEGGGGAKDEQTDQRGRRGGGAYRWLDHVVATLALVWELRWY
jgi:hypothetical protein